MIALGEQVAGCHPRAQHDPEPEDGERMQGLLPR
jgi:hypothetical protein